MRSLANYISMFLQRKWTNYSYTLYHGIWTNAMDQWFRRSNLYIVIKTLKKIRICKVTEIRFVVAIRKGEIFCHIDRKDFNVVSIIEMKMRTYLASNNFKAPVGSIFRLSLNAFRVESIPYPKHYSILLAYDQN